MNIFEKATKMKLRFEFRGLLSTEDLWDLNLELLDQLYKTLIKKKKSSDDESLLNVKTKEDDIIDLQIEIVKHIVTIKLEEKAEKENKIKKEQ